MFKAWRFWSKSNFILTIILVGSILAGCNLSGINQEIETTQPSLKVPAGGWVLASAHQVWVVNAQGEEGEPYNFTATVKGVLIRPTTRDVLVFLEEGGTWSIWNIGATEADVLYSTKVPLSNCSLAPNGHALACLQAGDLYVIQLVSRVVERIDSGVTGVTWSPTNSDLVVHFTDRTELIGLTLNDHLATRTVLLSETGDHPQFISTEQLVWWQDVETERQLVLFSLRTKEKVVVWTGQAGSGSWLSPKGNQIVFSDQERCTMGAVGCLIQVVGIPGGQQLQTIEGSMPVGWVGQDVVVKTADSPIDQVDERTYHFAALSEDVKTDLGGGSFLALDTHLDIEFSQ